MLKRVLILSCMIMLFCTSALAANQESSRLKLSEMNIDFSIKSLVDSIVKGDAFLTDLLLDAGLDPNKSDINENTPLKIATIYRRADAIKSLVVHNAFINAKDLQGNTVTDIAIKRNDTNIVDLLKSLGGESNIKGDASFMLVNADIKNALVLGENNKNDLIYTESHKEDIDAGMFGNVQLRERVYLIPSLCAVANVAKNAKQLYKSLDPDEIAFAANNLELRIALVKLKPFSPQEFDNFQVIILQSGKVIRPFYIGDLAPQSQTLSGLVGTTDLYSIGKRAYFNAADIDNGKPFVVKTINNGTSSLTFQFHYDSGIKSENSIFRF
jgi:hypothetical protein